MFDFAVIGGGIVGLSTAMHLAQQCPKARLLVIEKEDHWAAHQTGHNSGVIHSGIYYKPGSYKAKMAVAGARSMVEFCQKHGIAHEVCGKLIVAVKDEELPRLENLWERGQANGVPATRLSGEEIQQVEPHVRGIAGLLVHSTGIADYRQVTEVYARLVAERGGELRLGTRVTGLVEKSDGVTLQTTQGEFAARFVINCAGLHSDRVAKMGGVQTHAKIVPFRGEYYELKPEKRYLVKHLIYPVPNPNFPFLGVHFTRMIDGNVHAGPNAVLSLKREGYHKTDIHLGDLLETLTYPAFWKLAAKNWDEGKMEILRSLSKALFVQSMQGLIPEITADDVVPSHAGVRAQALASDGKLVDDFLIVPSGRQMHVCNAPSPAATASLEIGKEIVAQIRTVVPQSESSLAFAAA